MAQSGSFAGNLSPSVIPSYHNSPALPPHPPHKHTRYKTHSRYALFIQRGRSIPFSMCEHLAWFGSSWLPWRAGRGRTTRTRRRRRGLSSLTPQAEHGTHQRLKGAEATFFCGRDPKVVWMSFRNLNVLLCRRSIGCWLGGAATVTSLNSFVASRNEAFKSATRNTMNMFWVSCEKHLWVSTSSHE